MKPLTPAAVPSSLSGPPFDPTDAVRAINAALAKEWSPLERMGGRTVTFATPTTTERDAVIDLFHAAGWDVRPLNGALLFRPSTSNTMEL